MTVGVLVSGHKRAGKDTFTDSLIEHFSSEYPDLKVTRYALADAMKSFVCKCLQISLEELEVLKENEMEYVGPPSEFMSSESVYYRMLLNEFYEEIDDVSMVEIMSKIKDCMFPGNRHSNVRGILQRVGQGMKQILEDDEIWCSIVMDQIDDDSPDVFIVTDVRLQMEQDFFNKITENYDVISECFTVKIYDPNYEPTDSHVTESQWSNIPSKWTYANNKELGSGPLSVFSQAIMFYINEYITQMNIDSDEKVYEWKNANMK